MDTLPLYSLSISARLTLDMHSLNNEGGEGNQIQTRMVNIVDAAGSLQNVNAISGDMYKHIQAEHLFRIAQEKGLPLCAGCREFNANRINADSGFLSRTAGMSDADVTHEMLMTCVLDDIEGILITEGKRSLPRKSVVEFGWVVGVPESVQTDSYFHVKYNRADRAKTSESRDAEEKSGANLGQAIFHRPASSGIYALVCHVDFARIGFNDILQDYAIDDEQRLARARALLESIAYTFIHPAGAMRSAQAPHIVNVEGVITWSVSATPAPTISPLNTGYDTQIGNIIEALRKVNGESVQMARFDTLDALTNVVGDLMDYSAPYALKYR